MTEYFFTADSHFGHAKIIEYCNRPFKSIGEHDYRLIQLWNGRITNDDIIFHLGDFCFKEEKEKNAQYYLSQLNGQKIILRGNHDNNNSLKTCIEDIRIHLGGKNILLIHNPNESSYGFNLVLAGHVHQKWKFKTMTYEKYKWDVCNVGVDVWKFKPIIINEVLEAYGAWKRGD